MSTIPALSDVETAIGIQALNWRGRCYEIACKIVKTGLVDGTALYGHYAGYIDPKSYFGKRHCNPFVQHGWIMLSDGYVLDPTRWTFEHGSPYLFHAHPSDEDALLCLGCHHFGSLHANGCDERKSTGVDCDWFNPEPWPYDEGGNRFRQGFFRPAPAVNSTDKRLGLDVDSDVADYLASRLSQDQGKMLTMSQICWVANISYLDLESNLGKDGAYKLYKAIVDIDETSVSFIPVDNKIKSERETGRSLEPKIP